MRLISQTVSRLGVQVSRPEEPGDVHILNIKQSAGRVVAFCILKRKIKIRIDELSGNKVP